MPRAEDYEHLPIRQVPLEWMIKPNDPRAKGGNGYDQEHQLQIDLAVHPNQSGRIIVNYPGLGGDIDGYNLKYKKLALYMQGENLGAVVRSEGPNFWGYMPDTSLRKMLEYSYEHEEEISGVAKPEFLLMGFSAGASAIAAVAHDYERVSRILLMAPSGDMGMKAVTEGLQKFAGEVFIVIGREDDVVGVEAGQKFYEMATGASKRELYVITNCDHQFKGELNGRIMSQAPFYAFARGEKPQFPNPEGGIVLYS